MAETWQQQLIGRWRRLRGELDAAGVKMLAVSKYAPEQAVQTLIDAGESRFAESRAQSLRDRAGRWPGCEWHMIGPMQRNKAKYIACHAAMWHSCEDLAMAGRVAELRAGKALPVLIQVNLAALPQQHGVMPENVAGLAEGISRLDGLRLVGLMGMAPRLDAAGEEGVRAAFGRLRGLRDDIFGGSLGELCMGMSGDYRIAIEEGATMVRLGTLLFGSTPETDTRTDYA